MVGCLEGSARVTHLPRVVMMHSIKSNVCYNFSRNKFVWGLLQRC